MYKLNLKNKSSYEITDVEAEGINSAYELSPLPPRIKIGRLGLSFNPYDLAVMEPYKEDGYMINAQEILKDIRLTQPEVYLVPGFETAYMVHVYLGETSGGLVYFVTDKEEGLAGYINYLFVNEAGNPRLYLPDDKRELYIKNKWMFPYEDYCNMTRELLLNGAKSLATI